MLKTLTSGSFTRLAGLGAVRVQGVDARRFLQGQLSNDTEKLTASRAQFAGLHTPQGRAIALLRLMVVGPDEVLAVLPRELAAPVAARLSKYVLRAKAQVTDVSADWRFYGLLDAERTGLPEGLNAQAEVEASFVVRIGEAPARWLLATRADADRTVPEESLVLARWRALDIAAGLPQVYAVTSEAFVAQMLNLDVLGAVAFDKGCYTGQEVVARAHYRGRVKRRMQRFQTTAVGSLAVGASGKFRDGRSFRVVDAVQLSDGGCEFLAVTAMSVAADDASEAPVPSANVAEDEALLDAESLPLPYSLPD